MADSIDILTLDHSHYPVLLKQIAHPPRQLYVRGNPSVLTHPYLLAVVGSRKATYYGKQVADKLLPPLIQAGLVLVSGLAHGIDGLAHRACVERKAPTIAVLGCGVDDESLYPKSHQKLVKTILETGGVLISEYPPGTKALLHHFPARNRLIAGLCQATLIIQAAQKSGSLITARFALESNREVCAIPGQIFDPLSAGTNDLIRQGALLVSQPEEILELYHLAPAPETISSLELTSVQQQVFTTLSSQPQPFEQLLTLSSLPIETLSSVLTELELLGVVEHIGGLKYVKK